MISILKIIFILLSAFGFFLIDAIPASSESDQESVRDMVQRLQQEIRDMQFRIAENPSLPEASELKMKIQWNERKIRDISPDISMQSRDKMKEPKKPTSGLDRYMVIHQKNLFAPLRFGDKVKQQEYTVTGILSMGKKKTAMITTSGGSGSYYVTEGESFGNGAKVISIRDDSVIIAHDGEEVELKLDEGKKK